MTGTQTAIKLAERSRHWQIAAAQETFTAHSLSADGGRSLEFCRKLIKDWIRFGYVSEAGTGPRGRKLFRVTAKFAELGEEPPQVDAAGKVIPRTPQTPEKAMWRTMRYQRTFRAADVAMMANTETTPVTEAVAHTYCRHLCAAGYLRALQKATKSRSARYQIVKDSGPEAPVIRRVQAIFDPNVGKVTHVIGGQA